MTIHEFIIANNIKPADAIMMNKKFLGMLDHYVIYLGIYDNKHQFVANYSEGVKLISEQEITSFLSLLQITGIEHFPGTDSLRPAAVERAKQRIGEKAYTLLSNNCEHFKNWVHYGIQKSVQVENLSTGLAIGGITLASVGIADKNPTLFWVGLAATLIAGITGPDQAGAVV